MTMSQPPTTKVLFVGTEDGAFCQHRLPMARALRAAGYDVHVCARDGGHRERIEHEGFTFVPWNVRRGSLNPLRELAALLDLRRIVKREAPDVMINVALKPILYGGLCARWAKTVHTVNLFAGLGAVFVHPRPVMKAVQVLILPFLRFVTTAPNAWLVTQNRDNLAVLQSLGVGDATRAVVIPGSGIDIDAFAPTSEPANASPIVVTLVGRMLWDKGIRETVEAARRLKQDGVDVRIDLVGAPDPHNPATVTEADLRAFSDEGVVNWRGSSDDIASVWTASHIALLPSYGEGVPKSLLEAAAMGRPLIAFDAPGSRDLVRSNENGILVPFKDVSALATAIKTLAESAQLRRTLGAGARQTVETTYAADIVGAQVVDLLARVMACDTGGRSS